MRTPTQINDGENAGAEAATNPPSGRDDRRPEVIWVPMAKLRTGCEASARQHARGTLTRASPAVHGHARSTFVASDI